MARLYGQVAARGPPVHGSTGGMRAQH